MIPASKSTLSLNNLKILRPIVTQNLTNLCNKFCEFHPWFTNVAKHCFIGSTLGECKY